MKQIDFSWTIEEDCKRLGMISIPKLTAVKMTNKGKLTSCLAGVQLIFADGIVSPIFSSEGIKEESLVNHDMIQDEMVTSV